MSDGASARWMSSSTPMSSIISRTLSTPSARSATASGISSVNLFVLRYSLPFLSSTEVRDLISTRDEVTDAVM